MPKVPLVPDVEKILSSLGVLGPVQQWALADLHERNISPRYASEMLDPLVQRAYGQGVHQVTSLAAMQAAAQEDSANAYIGGNLVERLQRIVHEIKGVDVRTSTRVVGIKHQEIAEGHPVWLIQHENAESGSDLTVEAFDKVIMAAFDWGIRLESSDGLTRNLTAYHETDVNAEDAALDDNPFVSVHITFFTSEVKPSPWADEDQVLFLDARRAGGMRELALVREIVILHDGGVKIEYLYRALSQAPVLEELQNHCNITWSYQTRVCAPPE
jgi:hypothetical protein